MSPLVKEFLKDKENFDTRVCVTAQHREMLDQVLTFFEIIPDYDLDLMKPNQNLYTLTSDIILGLKFMYVHRKSNWSLDPAWTRRVKSFLTKSYIVMNFMR